MALHTLIRRVLQPRVGLWAIKSLCCSLPSKPPLIGLHPPVLAAQGKLHITSGSDMRGKEYWQTLWEDEGLLCITVLTQNLTREGHGISPIIKTGLICMDVLKDGINRNKRVWLLCVSMNIVILMNHIGSYRSHTNSSQRGDKGKGGVSKLHEKATEILYWCDPCTGYLALRADSKQNTCGLIEIEF